MDLAQFTLLQNLMLFAAVAFVIAVGGVAMTTIADKLADRTHLGEAIVGGALLGASTSLSGTVTSVSSAAMDHPSLAVSNAIGGIAVQTVFLAFADLLHRRANLEHAAASAINLIQAALLIVMLSLPLSIVFLPPFDFLGVHLISPVIVFVYLLGLRLTDSTRQSPMWEPSDTPETRRDVPEADPMSGPTTLSLFTRFLILALIVGVAGWLIAETGIVIAAKSGLTETVVGALMTAIATSLPELVTTVAAVRRNALQLAVGGIIGGNTFDVLFLVPSDIAYRPGSIYHAAEPQYLFWIAVSLLMTGILLLGLIRREKHGFANIGFESTSIIIVYAVAVVLSTSVL